MQKEPGKRPALSRSFSLTPSINHRSSNCQCGCCRTARIDGGNSTRHSKQNCFHGARNRYSNENGSSRRYSRSSYCGYCRSNCSDDRHSSSRYQCRSCCQSGRQHSRLTNMRHHLHSRSNHFDFHLYGSAHCGNSSPSFHRKVYNTANT